MLYIKHIISFLFKYIKNWDKISKNKKHKQTKNQKH
jgi:hypothetical protein